MRTFSLSTIIGIGAVYHIFTVRARFTVWSTKHLTLGSDNDNLLITIWSAKIKEEIFMSEAQAKTVKLLDTKLDAKTIKTITVCAIVMVIAVLIHDGDHIRQALNWGYSIPISLWVLNLTVYVLPVVTLFLARSGRLSATLVGAVAGVFTTASFLILHLCGSFTGNWGVWNFSYFDLINGVTYNGVFYQGIDWLSWVLLFHIPVCCLPCSWVCFKEYLRIKNAAK